MEEIFRDIIGYEKVYSVSNLGTIISKKKNKPMRQYVGTTGYYYFRASLNGIAKHIAVARCVARAFPEICGEWFERCTVDHINTVKTDNRAENLRVVTLKENINNPLTIIHMRKGKTEEEYKEYLIERKKQYRKKDYQKNKKYYFEYHKKYQKTEKYKKYLKERYDNRTEEQKRKNREKAKNYYYEHRNDILTKARERYKNKKLERTN